MGERQIELLVNNTFHKGSIQWKTFNKRCPFIFTEKTVKICVSKVCPDGLKRFIKMKDWFNLFNLNFINCIFYCKCRKLFCSCTLERNNISFTLGMRTIWFGKSTEFTGSPANRTIARLKSYLKGKENRTSMRNSPYYVVLLPIILFLIKLPQKVLTSIANSL